mmetsp:Transcript_12670/g.19097  ORF Transcript_12670/g.19097 Transcript_12670/m.19097 type:complete len:467 (+) Transcript_12670:54-1454(+)
MSSAPTQSGKAEAVDKLRTESPCPQGIESPSKNGILSTTKSWCSSPFSNLVALSPDGNSFSFSLTDFSPGMPFSSPRLRFNTDHGSPQSSSRAHGDQCSFSPSLFSPFNKSLKSHKLDKLFDGDFLGCDSIIDSATKCNPEGIGLFQFGLRKCDSSDIHTRDNISHLLGTLDTRSDCMELDTTSGDSLFTEDTSKQIFGSPMKCKESRAVEPRDITTLDQSPSFRPPLSSSKKSIAPPQTTHPPVKLPSIKRAHVTPGRKSHNKFSSPAVLSKAKQPANMSPMDSKSRCNCKKSKCLKLYCECFSALRYCIDCNCTDCNNCKEYEEVRSEAIQATKERNPIAFHSKVSDKKGHLAGCNCQRSQCLKKYCECFEGSVHCGTNCKCKSCENYSGSAKLEAAKNTARQKRERYAIKSESCNTSSVPPKTTHLSTTTLTTLKKSQERSSCVSGESSSRNGYDLGGGQGMS